MAINCPENAANFPTPFFHSGTVSEPRVFVSKRSVLRPGKWTSQKPEADPVCAGGKGREQAQRGTGTCPESYTSQKQCPGQTLDYRLSLPASKCPGECPSGLPRTESLPTVNSEHPWHPKALCPPCFLPPDHRPYLRCQHVLGEVEREGRRGACCAGRGTQPACVQPGGGPRPASSTTAAAARHRGQQVTHAHGGESSGAHGKLSRVQEERLAGPQRPEELLPVQMARESQARQVSRAQGGRTVRLHHQRRQAGLLALARLLAPVVLPPRLGALLLQAPQAKWAVPAALGRLLAPLGAAPLPGALRFGQARGAAAVQARAAA